MVREIHQKNSFRGLDGRAVRSFARMAFVNDDSLRETVVRARDGDERAVGELLAEHLPPLEAFVRLRAGSLLTERESIHDLVQSVCREALQDIHDIEYRGEREFRNWLYLLATRKLVDRGRFHRQAKRDAARERGLGSNPGSLLRSYASILTPSRAASAREEVERIEAAIQRLPGQQAEAVAYSRVLGLDYPDIAARMKVSESAVRAAVSRGLARLADELADET